MTGTRSGRGARATRLLLPPPRLAGDDGCRRGGAPYYALAPHTRHTRGRAPHRHTAISPQSTLHVLLRWREFKCCANNMLLIGGWRERWTIDGVAGALVLERRACGLVRLVYNGIGVTLVAGGAAKFLIYMCLSATKRTGPHADLGQSRILKRSKTSLPPRPRSRLASPPPVTPAAAAASGADGSLWVVKLM